MSNQGIVCINSGAFIGVHALGPVGAIGEANTLGRLQKDDVGNLVPAVRVVEQLGGASGVERIVIGLELTKFSEQADQRGRTRTTVQPKSWI